MSDDGGPDERLHDAARAGNLNEVRRLIDEGCDVSGIDADLHQTPLHYAAEGEHLDVARILLERGADVDAHHVESIGETPLGLVAATCSVEMAELLVQHGADPTLPGWMQQTALSRAERRKKPEGRKVFELLKRAAQK